MLPSGDPALALLADLAEAAGGAHNAATLAHAAAGALERHLPIRWFDLALPGESSRPLSPPLAQALAGGSRLFLLRAVRAPEARAPEIQRARAAGAAMLVALVLQDDAGSSGHALVAIDAPPMDLLTPALLDAAARVLGAFAHKARVVGRVAALSRRAHQESRLLRDELARAVVPMEIVAASPAMRAIVHDIVPAVAAHPTTVMLRGESGSGKEVIARRIHALSRRHHRPFVKVNCGALPEGLVESALFGHERGAFTGATDRHTGVFERTNGGTLLLDEVAELPLAAQVKLLRVLQEGEIERVGGQRTIHVDARVIAATHRDLEAMVGSGAFRSDLYYRLNVFPIVIPPLRERPEDIEPLAATVVARLARKLGRTAPRVPHEVMAALTGRPWLGNVRELENVLERAMVLSPGKTLRLPPPLPAAQPPGSVRPHGVTGETGVETFDDGARRVIQTALKASRGRISGADGAAARLGLKPTTLQSKMRKLGVRRDDV